MVVVNTHFNIEFGRHTFPFLYPFKIYPPPTPLKRILCTPLFYFVSSLVEKSIKDKNHIYEKYL